MQHIKLTYDEKREAKKTRLIERIERLEAFAKKNDFSLFSEERSGIPLGQPILVGHHSERRHRRHLERMEGLLRKGMNAGRMAQRLKERLASMEHNRAIQVDNPDALELIQAKINKLSKQRETMKTINMLLRKSKGEIGELELLLDKWFPDMPDTKLQAVQIITNGPFKAWELTNIGAEIRRLEARKVELSRISEGFEPFNVGDIKVELVDGQIQVEFPSKPNEATRTLLKRSPVALKWSSYSKRWVRKHTATTCGQYFKQEIIKVLEGAGYE